MGREPREVWEKRVARWRESGLSAVEFAAEIGVNHHTLGHWAWRLGRESARESSRPTEPVRGVKRSLPAPPPAAASDAPTFVELVAAPCRAGEPVVDASTTAASSTTIGFEVVLAGGRTVRVPAKFDVEALRCLVAVLEAA